MGYLDGKVAIVTGASRGVGAATAIALAAEGASVVCAARVFSGLHRGLVMDAILARFDWNFASCRAMKKRAFVEVESLQRAE